MADRGINMQAIRRRNINISSDGDPLKWVDVAGISIMKDLIGGPTGPPPTFIENVLDTGLGFCLTSVLSIIVLVALLVVLSPFLIPQITITAAAVELGVIYPDIIESLTTGDNAEITLLAINDAILAGDLLIQFAHFSIEVWDFFVPIMHIIGFQMEQVGKELFGDIFKNVDLSRVMVSLMRLGTDLFVTMMTGFNRLVQSSKRFLSATGTAAGRSLLSTTVNDGLGLTGLSTLMRKWIELMTILGEYFVGAGLEIMQTVVPFVAIHTYDMLEILKGFFVAFFDGELKRVRDFGQELISSEQNLQDAGCVSIMGAAYAMCELTDASDDFIHDIESAVCAVDRLMRTLGVDTSTIDADLGITTSASSSYMAMARASMRALAAIPDAQLDYGPTPNVPPYLRGNIHADDFGALRERARQMGGGNVRVFHRTTGARKQTVERLRPSQGDEWAAFQLQNQKLVAEREQARADLSQGFTQRKLQSIESCLLKGPLGAPKCVWNFLNQFAEAEIKEAVKALNKALTKTINGVKDTLNTLTTEYNSVADDITKVKGEIGNLQGKLDGIFKAGTEQFNRFFTNFKNNLNSVFQGLTNNPCKITIPFLGKWGTAFNKIIDKTNVNCDDLHNMCGNCKDEHPATCVAESYGKLWTNITNLTISFNTKFDLGPQILLAIDSAEIAMADLNSNHMAWAEKLGTTDSKDSMLSFMQNIAELGAKLEVDFSHVVLGEIKTPGGKTLNVPDYGTPNVTKNFPQDGTCTGATCCFPSAENGGKCPGTGLRADAHGPDGGSSQFDEDEAWPRASFKPVSSRDALSGRTIFATKTLASLLGVDADGNNPPVTMRSLLAKGRFLSSKYFAKRGNVSYNLMRRLTQTTQHTPAEAVINRFGDLIYPGLSSTNTLVSTDPNSQCQATEQDPFKCCSSTGPMYECCRGLFGCIPNFPANTMLTPISSLDALKNLDCSSVSGGGNPLWAGFQQIAYLLRLSFSGKVSTFLTKAPGATAWFWRILLGWLEFPGGVPPDNAGVCFLLNSGGIMLLLLLITILNIIVFSVTFGFISSRAVNSLMGTLLGPNPAEELAKQMSKALEQLERVNNQTNSQVHGLRRRMQMMEALLQKRR